MKIGAFTIGGGYAMLPLIEREVVTNRGWIDKKEFADMVVVSQTAPGILAMNIAVLVGNKIAGRKGAIFSAIGAAIPSFFIILIFAMFLNEFRDNRYLDAAFKAIRPAVVALIAVPIFNMAKMANLTFKTFWIPILSALLIWQGGISPVVIILLAAFAGIVVRLIKDRRERR